MKLYQNLRNLRKICIFTTQITISSQEMHILNIIFNNSESCKLTSTIQFSSLSLNTWLYYVQSKEAAIRYRVATSLLMRVLILYSN